MPFPTTVSIPDSPSNNAVSANIFVASNGDFFTVLTNAASQATFFRSTDRGVTWAEVDGVNAKTVTFSFSTPNSQISGYASCQNGDLIHVVYATLFPVPPTADSITRLTISTFDMSTVTWGSTTDSILGFGTPPPATCDVTAGKPFTVEFRVTDNMVLVVVDTARDITLSDGSCRGWPYYAKFDTVGVVWDLNWTKLVAGNDIAKLFTPERSAIDAAGNLHVIGDSQSGNFSQVILHADGTLVDPFDTGISALNSIGNVICTPTEIAFSYAETNSGPAHLVRGDLTDAPVWADETAIATVAPNSFNGLAVISFTAGIYYMGIVNDDLVALATLQYTSRSTLGVWAALTSVGSTPTNTLFMADLQIGSLLFLMSGSAPVTPNTSFWSVNIAPPAPPSSGAAKQTAGGGTYFPRFVNKTLLKAQIARVAGQGAAIVAYREFAPLSWLYDFPNDFDVCLSREWRLYNQIDPTALSCARKPDCFSGEEGARPWVEPPPGAVTFNPDKAIPLPDPATVNAVVLSFRVPIAYDGILLAQYHAYRGAGVFVEASGDIVWRVRANGRYLRDMGNMQLSIGSPQTLSPVPGGLWLYSGDLVEYVVSAPNGSGNLPLPGQGNILAGLHGWFWPRI